MKGFDKIQILSFSFNILTNQNLKFCKWIVLLKFETIPTFEYAIEHIHIFKIKSTIKKLFKDPFYLHTRA